VRSSAKAIDQGCSLPQSKHFMVATTAYNNSLCGKTTVSNGNVYLYFLVPGPVRKSSSPRVGNKQVGISTSCPVTDSCPNVSVPAL